MSCNAKLKEEHTGLMKSAGWSFGSSKFSCGESTFHVHMPDRQNPRKVICQTSHALAFKKTTFES